MLLNPYAGIINIYGFQIGFNLQLGLVLVLLLLYSGEIKFYRNRMESGVLRLRGWVVYGSVFVF